MNWTQLRKKLSMVDQARLLDVIKGLYALSDQNKAYLHTQLSESRQDAAFLEKCRKQVISAIYPPNRKYPQDPKFAEARKAINAYKKATGDIRGTIDLLLAYVELGTMFTSDFGDMDEFYYERLETALFNAVDLIRSSPTRNQLYAQFQERFEALKSQAGDFGWGYGEVILEAVYSLEDLEPSDDPG